MTVLGCGCEPGEDEEEDWPGGLGREVAGDGESTPVCFWLRGTEADWEIHESGGKERKKTRELSVFSYPISILSEMRIKTVVP